MADTSVTRLGFLGRQRAPDADRYRALRGAASNPFCKITTAQPAVFLLTERLFLEGAERAASVVSSRPVRRMVAQSNP